MEKLAKFLEKSSIVRIWIRLNQSSTIFALVVALVALHVAYSKYTEDRVKADEDRISKAWSTLTNMSGKGSNGGQINAIQILVNSDVKLDQVNLSNTYLGGANLKGAFLRNANLSGANLSNANLQSANLSGANLKGTVLVHANLGGAMFDGADLSGAILSFSKLDIAVVLARSMSGADITGVKFVLEDSDGNSDFSVFGDTVAESWRADERQERINETCSDKKWNEPQDELLPVEIVNKPCKKKINYQNAHNQVYEFSE